MLRGRAISKHDLGHFFVKCLSTTDWDGKTVGLWGDYKKSWTTQCWWPPNSVSIFLSMIWMSFPGLCPHFYLIQCKKNLLMLRFLNNKSYDLKNGHHFKRIDLAVVIKFYFLSVIDPDPCWLKLLVCCDKAQILSCVSLHDYKMGTFYFFCYIFTFNFIRSGAHHQHVFFPERCQMYGSLRYNSQHF